MSSSAIGKPMPPIDFDRHTMSGTTPARSKLKKSPVRPQPAWMSSTMSGMSSSRVRSRSARSHGTDATFSPPSPCTVSTITAAGRSTPELGSSSSLRISATVSWPSPR